MRRRTFLIIFIITFVIETFVISVVLGNSKSHRQDSVKVNECVKTIENNYGNTDKYDKELEYSIIDTNNTLVYKTDKAHSTTLNEAILNNDIILDIVVDDVVVGKVFIKNNTSEYIKSYRVYLLTAIITISVFQLGLFIVYSLYLNKVIIKPFNELNGFAGRVAQGNLEIPLEVDRNHIFGEFSEAFDLMRTELKKARINEKKANDAKKEMVAKLSHDIKTPVASIKSTSEIGYEIAKTEKEKEYFNLINVKADQIKVLVDNLFNSSINEITEIDVNPSNYDSSLLKDLIKNADYLNRLKDFVIPECNIYIDKMRMQQTFDNIINNSYKYANTNIDINIELIEEYLTISFRDYGSGVSEFDLPLLKEKYKRGSNVKDEDGAGLGLYLANYFIDNMNGKMELSNSNPGFIVKIYIRLI